MKLLTKEIIKSLPPIGSTDGKDPADVPVIVKFFTPWSNWTWWATEGQVEEEDFLFFGVVEGHYKEMGYFVLSELASVTGPAGLKIERDLHFIGTLAEVMSGKKT